MIASDEDYKTLYPVILFLRGKFTSKYSELQIFNDIQSMRVIDMTYNPIF
jgi:hypothetical protein